MTIVGHIDRLGLCCAVCRTDIAAGGVSPGDGSLYCRPCFNDGKRADAPLAGQLELF